MRQRRGSFTRARHHMSVNKRFSEVIIADYCEGDISQYIFLFFSSLLILSVIVWANDHHLILVPALLRARQCPHWCLPSYPRDLLVPLRM